MSLLPSRPDTSAAEADAEPRVIGVDSDDADDVISALSSDTARQLLAELHEEPAPPSELAERADTSLQNAQYHLEKLQSAGAVSVVDTAYSAKGREMDVYAPADQPLVIFAGNEDDTTGLRAALSRLLGGLGILGIGSLAVQRLYGDAGTSPGEGSAVPGGNETAALDGATGTTSGGETAVNGTEYVLQATNVTDSITTTATDVTTTVTSTPEATDAAAGIEPGLLFFAGGAVVLALWLLVWHLR
ncbi:ArsR/SmtB family transcription factor [Halapricum hydrolyticum]|uniref:Helix-turn-helix domain-containing protein n=1 Tax=Halapricum hydrolyticum TaxID=2979991 RepID=A0AAE3LE04_9EURY|nr:helix-turn-helix domain-containing protein [Halapricum hydrolyticum]MCU4716678.1 helix-turn-helix domain-containing protein [Halapricum hydrolyticum]MCU4725717.1 helix-turn-helix domain-containing protein [Halapricum hydrolyticum]